MPEKIEVKISHRFNASAQRVYDARLPANDAVRPRGSRRANQRESGNFIRAHSWALRALTGWGIAAFCPSHPVPNRGPYSLCASTAHTAYFRGPRSHSQGCLNSTCFAKGARSGSVWNNDFKTNGFTPVKKFRDAIA